MPNSKLALQPKEQHQHYMSSLKSISEGNAHFMGMIMDKDNPLTNADLESLVKRFPERWARFSKWIGKLGA